MTDVTTARDMGYERTWLKNLGDEAAHHYGVDAERFLNQLNARLDRGDAVFGDQFLRRDNLAEAVEEACDFVAYCMMDCERARGTDDYEHAPELFRAALLVIVADNIVREVKSQRNG